MKKRLLGITLLGGAALLLAAPDLAQAQAEEGVRESGGFFSGPVLSRFLPGNDSREETLSQQFRPSRFRLGFFTTPAGDENLPLTSYRSGDQAASQLTALATLDYGSYYGATRLDTNRSFLLSNHSAVGELPGADDLAREENLSLSMEAGVKRQDFNAGLLYAYQSGYPTATANAFGGAHYPSYIFAPLAPIEQSLDYRSPEGHAVFLYLGYNVSQHLNLRGSLGLAKKSSGFDDMSQGLGEQSRRWGLDFAATYRLLDNLVYQAHLGYVSIDDASTAPAIPSLHGPSDGAPLSASGQGADSLYHIGSHIRMTF